MKHIKIFEDFSNPDSGLALLEVNGDWSKINKEGTPDKWIIPNDINITYYTNPSETQLRKKFDQDYGPNANWENEKNDFLESALDSYEDVIYEIFSGDQNGTSIYYYTEKGTGMSILISSDLDPDTLNEELKKSLNANYNAFKDNDSDKRNEHPEYEDCEDVLRNDDKEGFTDKFISHCNYVVNVIGTPILRKINFSIE